MSMKQQRFEILAPAPAKNDEVAEPLVQLCAFFIGPEEYVVDVKRVVEILRPQRITPIRGAPAFIEGVMHQRGTILPVVDLRKLLLGTQQQHPASPKMRLLVCLLGRKRVAFIVDQVSAVVRLKRSEIKPTPALGAVGPVPYVVGVCGSEKETKLLLDLKALLLSELLRDSERRLHG
jgi:purine-binding chemotaxis protein CheW